MKPQAAWPEGVIARYLTDAGQVVGDLAATVDLIEKSDRIVARCTTCPGIESGFHFDPAYTGLSSIGRATGKAAAWAQAHAEKCRALPRPRS